MMNPVFKKPDELIGRFAVVKLWPKLQAAEDENVARLKVTARSLGLQCVEITPDGRAVEAPHQLLTQQDLDFVIHLHFQTPKTYDVFSFVALWNPVEFYHTWGYSYYARHLLTHDDFLSCSATWTDDHAVRMTASDPTHLPPAFTMYHSLSEPVFEPTLGDRKIFYAGINWEKLGKKKGRHQELLNMLDPTGNLRIHGPRIFQGVDVWEGYQSYAGPIPFDGVSIIKEINRSGIALVLSSDAHKESELMSNRLFESLAGGALIICDENPFARRHFGDTILYIDASLPTDQVFAAIIEHMQWINAHPDQALSLARKAQAIFREKFSLDKSLIAIYNGLAERRKNLESRYAPTDSNRRVDLLLMLPEYSQASLERHISNVRTQRHAGCHAGLLVDEWDLNLHGNAIRQRISQAAIPLAVCPVAFFRRDKAGKALRRVRLGQVLSEAIKEMPSDALFIVVAPDEELFSEHVQLLAGALERNPEAEMAHAQIVYRHRFEGETYHDLQDELDYLVYAANRPLGFGRFLFRRSAFADHIHSALRYLDARAMALLVAACPKRVPTRRASLIADIQSTFNSSLPLDNQRELDVMRDYLPDLPRGQLPNTAPPASGATAPAVAAPAPTQDPALTSVSLKKLSVGERQAIAVDLAHSLPIPGVLKRIIFGSYRFWLRRAK